MNSRVFSVACAVLAFFAGAIWLNEANAAIVGTLVAFLSVAAGFGCGVWFKNADANVKIEEANHATLYYEQELDKLREVYKKLASEKTTAAAPKATKAKKNKE